MQTDPMHAPDFLEATEPFELMARWYAEAQGSEPRDANACQLATIDASGMPNIRTVLMKDLGPSGLVFYSNANSAKGQELKQAPKAALLLYWKTLSRQIRTRSHIVFATLRQGSGDRFG